jgi:hypothetical protein
MGSGYTWFGHGVLFLFFSFVHIPFGLQKPDWKWQRQHHYLYPGEKGVGNHGSEAEWLGCVSNEKVKKSSTDRVE